MKKLKFVTVFIALHSFALTTSAQQTVQYDILLKGGHVIDPANRISTICDVAIANGMIASVEKNIPSKSAKKVVDVSGYIVSPGFIDLHTHVFYTFQAPRRWVIPDHHSFQSGITTMVDAGTSGADNFEDFKKSMEGIYTTSVTEATRDEAPMVYKPMEEIVENIKECVEVVEVIKPIYNFKAQG